METLTLADRYTAVWNEPDEGNRRKQIAQLWTDGATHCTESLEAQGYAAIEERVSGAYEKWVREGGFRFRQGALQDVHHESVRLTWEMTPAGGGEVAAAGTVFMLLAEDGRILRDYQFTDPTPQS